ncbi:MAG TPA: SGNH/GDSL hydrolase family protein [Anaerolineae bacterium]|jgi:hypothetical protein
MMKLKTGWRILQSLLMAPLLAATLLTAAPVAAKTAIALPFICAPSSDSSVTVQIMVDVDSAYVYGAANWAKGTVGRVLKWECYDVKGRSSNNEWLLIPFGDSQAWIHYGSMRINGDLSTLPVMDKAVAKSAQIKELPQGLPYVNWHQRYLYQASRWADRDTSIFTVIGDCNSEYAVYLGRFAASGMDTSNYPQLAYTVNWFTDSFSRTSVATHGSFNAAMAFDSTWSDPKQCGSDEGPLACELRLSKASILVIALGTGDQHDWRNFEANYRPIIEYTLNQGVLPVLMTKADALESQEGGAPVEYINDVIRSLGAEYNVPVIDFWLATRNLPNHGMLTEQNDAQKTTNSFHLNEQGMDMRMFMTLQTIKSIAGL